MKAIAHANNWSLILAFHMIFSSLVPSLFFARGGEYRLEGGKKLSGQQPIHLRFKTW